MRACVLACSDDYLLFQSDLSHADAWVCVLTNMLSDERDRTSVHITRMFKSVGCTNYVGAPLTHTLGHHCQVGGRHYNCAAILLSQTQTSQADV